MIGFPNDDNWHVDNNIGMFIGFSDILSLFRQGLVKCMTISQLCVKSLENQKGSVQKVFLFGASHDETEKNENEIDVYCKNPHSQ